MQREFEAGGHHSHNRVSPVIERDGAADDSRIAAKLLLPEFVLQYHDVVASFIFDRQECSAELRSDAQKRKNIGGNNFAFQVSRAFDACQGELVVVISSDFFEDLVLRAPIVEIGIIGVAGFPSGARIGDTNAHEPARIMERKGTKQLGVYHREYRRVRPDSQSQRQYRDRSETGILCEHAHAVTNILEQGLHLRLRRYLLVAQSHHRVHIHCAPRGDVAREQRHQS